ncbi:Ankyrin repeat domain-containing protein 13C [Mortierella polycephala]|uniref:Ankyrin repeat domain-containing protein 13C n=1 Tax=Mortierella polycephala TaxID=41804 RepID=A0A9P6PX86_9FUNG|nr:Ankyrin repeat domain-containing protein 13C [Mortierella polycephala]
MSSITVDPVDPWALHKLVFLNKAHTLKMFLAPYKTVHHPPQDTTTSHSKDNDTPQHNHHHPAINKLDHHLHAPLHVAVMLNRKDIVSILLKAGANPLVRSGSGWTPRQEATSLGDRELIEILTRYQRKEFSGSFKTKAMKLVKQLSEDLDQFYFQLQWEFQSWVPFVSGLCPDDTYHIWKKGNAVRMDTSLVGFENMKWIRGHISIIFRVDPESGTGSDAMTGADIPTDNDDMLLTDQGTFSKWLGPELVIVDRVKKITQRLARSSDEDEDAKRHREPTDEEIEDEVSFCYNSDITSTNVPTSAIKFQRAKSGMWGYRTNKVEKVGEYECAVWKMDGVEFRTRVRTEHLKDKSGKPIESFKRKGPEPDQSATTTIENGDQPEQPQQSESESKNGAVVTVQGQGSVAPRKHVRNTGTISDDAFFETALEEAEADMDLEEELEGRFVYRDSLPPPPPPTITFEEYFDATKPGELHLGRALEQKESHKAFGATLWMYENSIGSSGSSSTANLLTSTSTVSLASSSAASSTLDNSSVVSNGNGNNRAQFPLTIEKILPLLEVIGMDNNRLVGKLKEFLEFKLPPGFPIRANIPVYPSLSADVTFVNYDASRIIEDDMFDVPDEKDGYMEGFVIRPGGDDDV